MKSLTFTIEKQLKHFGICDASAAVPLGEDYFIVGNDEADEKLGNVLRVYASHTSGPPIKIGSSEQTSIDINGYFENNPKNKEIDLEAVSELNGVIYWITSHGRNKKGKFKPERHQFFGTRITQTDGSILEQVGKSYTQLVLRDMLEDSKLEILNFKEAETLAPKAKGGLCIEGLTATPEGELLIGFRNPIPQGKALLVTLKNPHELANDPDTARAVFGDTIELDLGGLGIRSIEYWSSIEAYLIIAGPFDGGDEFALYSWSGNCQDNPKLVESLQFPEKFRPESVLFYPHLKDTFQILSDDGAVLRANGQPCKDIQDKNHPEKYFQSIWVKVT
ncbi:MAG: DUF3616 domain-containing protein [Nostoc sp. ChiSLP02]|nr:DUF3616 domain-containing protein [Nostoc sp. DedSLP05]MDZ8098825.1 DUF3616 domain-containing protein [Nostoc sp. DedSLP01]MDZ8183561.1 DUF3616 domain-containing protein [Nostoc sp. ChiSLP02]